MKYLELMEIDFENLLSNGWRKKKDFYFYYAFNICVSLIFCKVLKMHTSKCIECHNRCPSIPINESILEELTAYNHKDTTQQPTMDKVKIAR